MKQCVLLFDEDVADPIVTVVSSDPELSEKTEKVPVGTIYDRLVPRWSGARVHFSGEAELFAEYGQACRRCLLLNRLVDLSANRFQPVEAAVNQSLYLELTPLLGRFIGIFHQAIGRPGLYCLAGNKLPLPLQYWIVDKHVPALGTPRFEYPFGAARPNEAALRQPIYKSPFDLYLWSSEASRSSEWNHFAVDRPPGILTVGFYFCDSAHTFVPDGCALPEGVLETIRRFTRGLRDVFESDVGEVLFFADGDRITFAAHSLVHRYAATSPMYRDIIKRELTALLDLSEQLV